MAPTEAVRRTKLWLIGIVLLGLGVRLGALWAGQDARLVLDEQLYRDRAVALLDGEGYVGSFQSWVKHSGPVFLGQLPQYPGSYQPPGYPTFIAGVFALSGRSVFTVKVVQVLLSTATIVLVWWVARHWLDDRRGLLAAALTAAYPNLIAFSHYLWSETLYIFVFMLAIGLLAARRTLPGWGTVVGAGALLGLAALTRSLTVYFLPLLLLWLIWVHRAQWRAALVRAGVVVGAMAVVIAPWSIRSSLLHGGFVLIETSGPYNVWRGNTPNTFAPRMARQRYTYPPPFQSLPIAPVGLQHPRALLAALRGDLGLEQPTDLQVAAGARKLAWKYIADDPGAFVARAETKLIDMWNPTSFLVRHLVIGAYGPMTPRTASLISWTAMIAYVVIVVLATVGMVCSLRLSWVWLIMLWIGYLSLAAAVAFGLTRFRLPAMPFIIILAAQGVCMVARLFRVCRPVQTSVLTVLLAASTLWCTGCERPSESSKPEPAPRPNIVWIVWDTVRADHLSVYGHARPTTPLLEEWARGARVFDNCVSVAPTTTPSHASMFTGLLPTEHGANDQRRFLADGYSTVAELLHASGYQTYLYSANPHIGHTENFHQGFDVEEHPWDPQYRAAAYEIVREKISPLDKSCELPDILESGRFMSWHIKACGELAQRGTLRWLAQRDANKPFFVFLNYMEAHRPYIPPEEYRRRLMSDAQVRASYEVDRSWVPMWAYTFGLREYSEQELELTGLTYDATLLELDELFHELMTALGDGGYLENTIVILTADHGEHLGEQHMLDHQYSVYQPLLHVPLLVHYPRAFAPGRDSRPVCNFDLFPTLLELAGVEPPAGLDSQAVSLTQAPAERHRLSEYPAAFTTAFARVKRAYPDFDPQPWIRSLRALFDGPHKLIAGSDGSYELFDVSSDPLERVRLDLDEPVARRMAAQLKALVDQLEPAAPTDRRQRTMTPAELARLRSLGYVDGPAEDEEEEFEPEP